MNFVLFDDPAIRVDLMPFTFTRPVGAIRVGILTIRETWEKFTGQPFSYLAEGYLQERFPLVPGRDNFLINGAVCPDKSLLSAVQDLKTGEALVNRQVTIAARTDDAASFATIKFKSKPYLDEIVLVDQPWKIFGYNGAKIRSDFEMITRERESAIISDPHTRFYAPEYIFVEEGAVIQAAVLNASNGPIYIGRNSQVQEGSIVRGPFSLGEGSILNLGTKIRGDTSVGPHCKVGGEVSNSVIFGFSNKVHDGFLGASVLGEWCNLGADTNTSNLKNNYDDVKLWSYARRGFQSTGLIFCGLMMGDHSKCGINTMFNTGTVVGVSANIFGAGYPRNFIPSFAWGGAAGFTTFQPERACETASRAMGRRNQVLTPAEERILKAVYELTAAERVWEKKP